MRVLLISENRCRDNMVPWPIGPACVASAARENGHEVRGLDLMFSGDATADVLGAVASFDPGCVGISLRNIDNQVMRSNEFYLPAAREVVDELKSSTRAPIVMGGAGFTIFPLECLDYFGLEFGLVGEAEGSFVELLRALEAGSGLEHVGGLALRRQGERRLNPPGPPVDLKTVPAPDRQAFDVSGYHWAPSQGSPFLANLQSRRGCALHCIYCSSPTVEGRAVRCRDPLDVADELEALEKEHGMTSVVFADSNFNHPAGYATELCEAIADKKLSIGWSCSVNPHWFDEELFGRMRQAGCRGVSLGNESGSEVTLEALRKEFSVEDVRRCARAISEAGMDINCFLLLGGPSETRETVEQSVALMDEIKPEAVRVTVGVRIFPGCELERIARERGVIEERQNLLYPTFYLEKGCEGWLYEKMAGICAARPGWFI
jgi:radical SAM superfamily enzyme YgiQ (UPF0313 family)